MYTLKTCKFGTAARWAPTSYNWGCKVVTPIISRVINPGKSGKWSVYRSCNLYLHLFYNERLGAHFVPNVPCHHAKLHKGSLTSTQNTQRQLPMSVSTPGCHGNKNLLHTLVNPKTHGKMKVISPKNMAYKSYNASKTYSKIKVVASQGIYLYRTYTSYTVKGSS